MSTVIVGLIFTSVLFLAAKRAFSDMKKGKCAGCSGCSSKESSTCQIDLNTK